MFSNELFYKRVFRFVHSICCSWNLVLCPSTYFLFLTGQKKLHKKVTKTKQKIAEQVFVDKVFSYDLLKENMVVVGAHERLESHSSVTILVTKHTPMLPLNYSYCLLHNILIQYICLTSCISLLTFQVDKLNANQTVWIMF